MVSAHYRRRPAVSDDDASKVWSLAELREKFTTLNSVGYQCEKMRDTVAFVLSEMKRETDKAFDEAALTPQQRSLVLRNPAMNFTNFSNLHSVLADLASARDMGVKVRTQRMMSLYTHYESLVQSVFPMFALFLKETIRKVKPSAYPESLRDVLQRLSDREAWAPVLRVALFVRKGGDGASEGEWSVYHTVNGRVYFLSDAELRAHWDVDAGVPPSATEISFSPDLANGSWIVVPPRVPNVEFAHAGSAGAPSFIGPDGEVHESQSMFLIADTGGDKTVSLWPSWRYPNEFSGMGKEKLAELALLEPGAIGATSQNILRLLRLSRTTEKQQDEKSPQE